jgi:asparagine synthase (glutamine-hydrolysing)
MTAIAGVVSARASPYNDSTTRELLANQRLYGPEHPQLATTANATFGVGPRLGLKAAPAVGGPGIMLVADVRLDNRAELQERFGQRSRGQSDTELLLAAWIDRGEDCLAFIAGDFALAVYDSRSRTLTLARDCSGQMPLHYALIGEDVAFASMPSGLRPFVGKLAIDRLALARSVCSLRDDDPRSNFEQIERTLPGEVVRLRGPAIRRDIYWKPPTAYTDPLRGVDLVEAYREVLDVAVAGALTDCQRPLATHLSSGYDSSAVTATAARLVGNPDEIIAFTSAPAAAAPVPRQSWRIGDESGVAAETAAALGVRHVIVRNSPPMRTVMRRQSLLMQELNINIPNIAWLLQIRREAAAAGANCLLSGECGNASLNVGGLYVLAEWVRQRRWLTWLRQARLAAARPDTHWRGVLFNSFEPWLPKRVVDLLTRRFLAPGTADEQSFLRPQWRSRAIGSACPPPLFANGYEARIHLIRNENPAILRKAGLAGENVDERDPLAEKRLIEFSLRLPPEALYRDGVRRPLAQAALADRVPKSVLDLKLRGLQGADWALRFTQADAYEMLEEISGSETARDLLDLERMKLAIGLWPTDNWNDRYKHGVYRACLIGALAGGMFALVHEQGGSVDCERL